MERQCLHSKIHTIMASHQIWPRPSILPPPSIIKLVTWENSIQSSKSALPHALMLLGATSMPCSCLGDLHGPVKEIGFSRNSLPAGTMRVGKSPVAPQKSLHAFVNAYAISSKKVHFSLAENELFTVFVKDD